MTWQPVLWLLLALLVWSSPNVTTSQVGIETLQLDKVQLSTILAVNVSHPIACRVTEAESTYMCAIACKRMAIHGEFNELIIAWFGCVNNGQLDERKPNH